MTGSILTHTAPSAAAFMTAAARVSGSTARGFTDGTYAGGFHALMSRCAI